MRSCEYDNTLIQGFKVRNLKCGCSIYKWGHKRNSQSLFSFTDLIYKLIFETSQMNFVC